MPHLLGYDIGSSSIKAALLDAETGTAVASATLPQTEMEISAPKPGWAEQQPETWWRHVKNATAAIKAQAGRALQDVQAIGISYQMHGLVLVDKERRVLRPSIIWCDSRAVPIGEKAFQELGPEACLRRFLNSPGNFTASKLKWVKDNEPEIYRRVYKFMLPGDYIAMAMTGEIRTTPSGLSEGILWDFQAGGPAERLLDYYGFDADLLPGLTGTFAAQGELTERAAAELGLRPGIKVAYRAGDQPNNAFSLNVLDPGELAATAGTSGVVYGVGSAPDFDPASRVNTFVHVNHAPGNPRYGILLCLNGAGSQNRWIRSVLATAGADTTYERLNELAARAPIGSGGIIVLPYGNGAERTLGNRDIGGRIYGVNFNAVNLPHLLRAVQEGIVFALNYGLEIMKGMGLAVRTIRAGHANMFLSPLFGEIFSCVTGARVELYNTDGAQGAARGAGVGAGIYPDLRAAFAGLKAVKTIEPEAGKREEYLAAYGRWRGTLERELSN